MQNFREQVAENIVATLKNMQDPRAIMVTREPFEVDKLAITQFPAVLITAVNETRQTITMGGGNFGRREGTIEYELRVYVRGTELDRQRNNIIERIEETLDKDRNRSLKDIGVVDSQITTIQIRDRLPPLAEISIIYTVRYNFLRGTV